MTSNHVFYSFFKVMKFLQIFVMKCGRKIITRVGDGKQLFEFQGPNNWKMVNLFQNIVQFQV